ncbi:MAG TPA: TIM barrel protein [Chthonomonadales bacterium]|nr:TIM barrel protein [Chthonomonadales bacterium]
MYKALAPYAIGVSCGSLEEAVAVAAFGGFQGLEVGIKDIASRIDRMGLAAVEDLFGSAGIAPAAWGLPTDWRSSDEAWKNDLADLPALASAAASIGCTRAATWILPSSNDRPFDLNYRFHVDRFKPIARILDDNGCSLGLEFIGPKTLRDSMKYPFVHTIGGMLAMAHEIGPNVGLLLDCWHWYTSHGTLDDLMGLRPEQVVYVHVNDAPAGLDVDQQVDDRRSLPGETGVIDITSFLRALQDIEYNGPVTPEPFKKELNDLPDDRARVAAVGQSMDRIFRQAGLA